MAVRLVLYKVVSFEVSRFYPFCMYTVYSLIIGHSSQINLTGRTRERSTNTFVAGLDLLKMLVRPKKKAMVRDGAYQTDNTGVHATNENSNPKHEYKRIVKRSSNIMP